MQPLACVAELPLRLMLPHPCLRVAATSCLKLCILGLHWERCVAINRVLLITYLGKVCGGVLFVRALLRIDIMLLFYLQFISLYHPTSITHYSRHLPGYREKDILGARQAPVLTKQI